LLSFANGPQSNRAARSGARPAKSVKRAVEVVSDVGLEPVVVQVDDESSIPMFRTRSSTRPIYAREFLARCRGATEARLELRVRNRADKILAAVETTAAGVLAIGWPHSPNKERGALAREILDRSRLQLLLGAVE